MRPYSASEYAQLKTATRRALHLAAPLRAITEHTRLDAAALSRAGNPCESAFVPIDVAIDLDAMAGDDAILRTMARLRGFELVPMKGMGCAADLMHEAGEAARQTGELVSSAIDAGGDGRITKAEARKIDGEAADVEAVVANIRKMVHANLGR